MKKIIFLNLLNLLGGLVLNNLSYGDEVPVNYRLDYLQLRIPDQTSSTGLLGAHIDAQLFPALPGFYAGVGSYGAIRGQNSGFFALGLEAGFQKNISPHWETDGGIFLGTGGGHDLASQIGDGQFLATHFGLLYNWSSDWGSIWFGPEISHWQFFQGNIRDNQIALVFVFPTEFFYLAPDESLESNLSQDLFSQNSETYSRSSLFSKNYFSFESSLEFPSRDSKNLSGDPMDNRLDFVGAEFGHFFTQAAYLFLNMKGAIAGNQNGFAEALGGLGYEKKIGGANSDWSALGQLGAGSAGGGGVNTRGGFIVSPSAGIEWDPINSMGLSLKAGYLWSPNLDSTGNSNNSYQAWTVNLGIKYYFDVMSENPSEISSDDLENIKTQNWRIRLGDQCYVSPDSNNSDENHPMHLLALKLDGFVNSYFYVTGQTSFAYTDNAAGYFSGMAGLGAQTQAYHDFSVYGELLGGAAGGAGLDIGTGLLIEPLIGIRYDLTNAWGLYGSVGKTLSPHHSFDSPTFDFGVSYGFLTV